MTPVLRILDDVRRLAVFVLVVALVAAGGCRRDSDSTSPPSTSSTVPPEIRVTASSVEVESMGSGPVAFPDEVRDSVVSTLNAWIDLGVVDPLLSGQPALGLDAAFTPEAMARLTPGSPDRTAMLEEGGLAAVRPEKASATLVALAGQDGALSLVTAAVEVAFVRVAGVDQVRVVRTGEVVLVPVEGGWRIDGYDVVTTHDTYVPPPATTTTDGSNK